MLTACSRFGFVFLCALLSGACAFWGRADFDRLALLSINPQTLGERTLEQRLVISWPGGERSLEAALEISADRLRLVLMSFGLRVSALEYDGQTLTETKRLPQAPPGARMVNDLLMIAAPLEVLRAALPKGWSVVESDGRRVFTRDDATQITIRYAAATPWEGQVEFEQHDLGYRLTLDSHAF
ncbi:MAG: DUF3261 domain-containing protein [Zoogloeaceae bacterium]|nr:DUF3261 domain-containing protein [Zoogloeaceae bacterium]